MSSSSAPARYRCATGSSGDRSPVPFRSNACSSARGSSAGGQQQQPQRERLAHARDRADQHAANISVISTSRPRWSVPNANGLEQVHRSGLRAAATRPARAWTCPGRRPTGPAGRGARRCRPPATRSPAGGRRPEASLSRRSMTSVDGHAVRQVDVGAPAGAVAGDRRGEGDRLRVLASAWLIPAMPSDGQRPDDDVAGQLGHARDDHGGVQQRLVRRTPGDPEDDEGDQADADLRPLRCEDQRRSDHRRSSPPRPWPPCRASGPAGPAAGTTPGTRSRPRGGRWPGGPAQPPGRTPSAPCRAPAGPCRTGRGW